MIIVVAHKNVKKIEKFNKSYVLVNAKKNSELKNKFELYDDADNNISEKNYSFCELTALYWLWKNKTDDEVYGLYHYRRVLSTRLSKKEKYFIDESIAANYLDKYDILLPKKTKFRKSRYKTYFEDGAGKEKDLIALRELINKLYPSYVLEFDSVLSEKSGHYCNVFVCKKDLLDEYCNWLFNILFELEKMIDISEYSASEKRIYGYLSELLLDVFIRHNQLKYKEFEMINLETNILRQAFYEFKSGLFGF